MDEKILIVGAGIAGLTLGYQLTKLGKKVVLIEKEATVGGLAKSFYYDNYTFDIGPHRFHTYDKKVQDFLYEILIDDYIVILRSSGVWMFRKYHDWPLHISSAMKMPISIMAKVGTDLFFRKKQEKANDFRTYVQSMYGSTITDIFFEPYTQKFMKYPTSRLHSDWAKAGINRAVIEKDIKVNSLNDLLKGILFPPKTTTEFIYPGKNGIGQFCNLLSKHIKSNGGNIITGCKIHDIVTDGEYIKAIHTDNGELECAKLVWTAPVTTFSQMLGGKNGALQYSSGVFFNIMLHEQQKTNYQWCYYGQPDICFARTSYPRNFNKQNVPEGCGSVCVEMSCMEGDAVWNRPEHFIDLIKKHLQDAKIISSEKIIKNIIIEKISNTYPIYEINYQQNLFDTIEYLRKWKNIVLLGRSGTFWYNNMDHSIRMALNISDDLINNREIPIGKYRSDFFNEAV